MTDRSPVEQVEYWITQGIAARTSLSQDEARQSARHLIQQYLDDRARRNVVVPHVDYSQYLDHED